MSDDGLIYLDHAASAPRRREVTEAMAPWMRGVVGNPMGPHRAARRARTALDDAREEVAALTGSMPGGVVFTGGGTESCNLAVFGVVADVTRRHRPASVVVSAIEHHAVSEAATRLGAGLLSEPVEVATLPVTASGVVDMHAIDGVVGAGTTLVSVMTANNEVGVVQPVEAICEAVRGISPSCVVHTDAVAAAPWLDLAVAAAGADLVSICGHKLGGPASIGALCLRRELALVPFLVGGGQERGRRSGTPDVAAAVGLATALRIAAREREAAGSLTAGRRDRLAKLVSAGLDGVEVTASGATVLPGTCHLIVEGVSNEELVFLCDDAGLCVSAASSCSSGATAPSHVLAAMGVDAARARGSIRMTLGAETTDDEVERAAVIVIDAVSRLRGR